MWIGTIGWHDEASSKPFVRMRERLEESLWAKLCLKLEAYSGASCEAHVFPCLCTVLQPIDNSCWQRMQANSKSEKKRMQC